MTSRRLLRTREPTELVRATSMASRRIARSRLPSWVAPMLPSIRAQAQPSTTSARPLVTLRPANRKDIPTLSAWDNEPHIIQISGTDGPVEWEKQIEHQPTWQKIMMAELGEEEPRSIGVVVIIDPAEEETGYWAPVERNLRAIDIWIGEKDCLAQGFGSQMMSQALSICFGEGCDAVLVDPLTKNSKAIRFYQKMGYREVGVRWFDRDECLVHRISRADYERINNKVH